MLNQTFEEAPQNSPAQATVTPKEFAEAVAVIENRKAGQALSTESVNVGDAIQQLGLTVSAEEVLTLVEHRRSEQEHILQHIKSRRRRVVSVLGRVAFALSLISRAARSCGTHIPERCVLPWHAMMNS